MSDRWWMSESLLSTTQAKHLLQASEALQQREAERPPNAGSFSMRVAGIPNWANSRAVVTPEMPPPMIKTSFLLANAALLVKKISYGFKKNELHKFGNCGLNYEFR